MFVSYSLTGGGHFEQACEGECKDQPTAAISKRPLAPVHSNDEMLKMAIILPTGQWYAPSAVINDAWYCIILHYIA